MAIAIRSGWTRLGSAALAAVLAAAGLTLGAAYARAATTSLCAEQSAPVAGGTYIVQNNEYELQRLGVRVHRRERRLHRGQLRDTTPRTVPRRLSVDLPGLPLGRLQHRRPAAAPVQVSALTPGEVTTSWSTTQTGSGAYDVAYDIWYNQTPTTTGQPNGTR